MDKYTISLTDGEYNYTFTADNEEFMNEFSKMLTMFFNSHKGEISINK